MTSSGKSSDSDPESSDSDPESSDSDPESSDSDPGGDSDPESSDSDPGGDSDPSAAFLESYSRPETGLHRFAARGMGTENVILLPGEDKRELGRHAQEALTLFDALEQRLSKFLPDSEVTLVNRLAATQPVFVSADLFRLLELSREAWEVSEGVFDPTVAALMEAWGLVDMGGHVPDSIELEEARGRSGMEYVELDAESSTVRFHRPGIGLDLGGIAKGWAADRLSEQLQKAGFPYGAVVCGRSTVVTWGMPPGDESWSFEVVHPADPEADLATLEAEPGAVSSSGAYERRFRRGAREYGHVLDPRSGRPAAGVLGATVWTQQAVWGDVLSTVLLVSGEAFLAGGRAEDLLRRWAPTGATPRVSVLLVEEDPSSWGGVRVATRHVGSPAFRASG